MRRLDVEIDLKEKENFYSNFNEKTLNPEVRDYIINELVGYDVNYNVTLKIKCADKLSNHDKEIFEKVIKKEFKECIIETNDEIRASNIQKIVLFTLGILCVVLSYTLINIIGEIISELLLIFGWLGLYEAVYTILFADLSMVRKLKRLKQISKAEIEFI